MYGSALASLACSGVNLPNVDVHEAAQMLVVVN